MLAETIAVGSEMLTPFRQDTNSLFITERLNQIGVKVAYKTTVGDRMEHLVNAVRTAASRVDIVVIMGGKEVLRARGLSETCLDAKPNV